MENTIDLQRYFQRIGYTGPATPERATLEAIHRLHPQVIPFENLNPFLGLPVQLDMPSIQQKLLSSRRGGYCYEHNLLLSQALKAMGFTVKTLSARVLWGRQQDDITGKTHMLMTVDVNGETLLADAGFGGLTLTAPLRLTPKVEQATPHETYRLLPHEEEYILQVHIKDQWKPVYRFDLRECYVADYEIYSWYLSNCPTSHFVTGLIAAKPVPGRRYALKDNEFTTHYMDGRSEKRLLSSVHELKDVLEDIFELQLPDHPELDSRLQLIIKNE